MKIIEGLKPWEVMQQHDEEGKRVACRVMPRGSWELAELPSWNWAAATYAIIDDTATVIDWEGFNWEFFNQYGGLPVFGNDSEKAYTYGGHIKSATWELRESPFYPWLGGECPVPGNVEVEIVLRGGNRKTHSAESLYWVNNGRPDEIIAFRLTGRVL